MDPDLNYVFWSPTEINSGLAIDMTRNNDPLVEDALQQGRRNATVLGPRPGLPEGVRSASTSTSRMSGSTGPSGPSQLRRTCRTSST